MVGRSESLRGTICTVCRSLASRIGGRGPAARIIDVHAHVQVADFLTFAAEAGLRRPKFGTAQQGLQPSSPAGDDEAAMASRLQLMDGASVRMQVLSPTLAPYFADEDVAVRAAQLANDGQQRLVGRRPDRFASFASLPLPHVEASLDEMRRALDKLGMAGVTLQCSCLGCSIAEDRFDPLFAELNARGAVLFLHPSVNGLASTFITDWSLTASAGPPMEDAVVALHLMVKGTPIRYPDIKIVVPHLGGGLSGQLERLDNQMPLFAPGLMGKPSAMARRLWYDTVSHGSRPALRAAAEAFGADRLVPGSDFPILLAHQPYAETFGYIGKAGLGGRDARRILHETAPRLLDL